MSSVQRSNTHSTAGLSSNTPETPSGALRDEKMNPESSSTATPARQPPRPGQETFWSPRLKAQRAGYLKAMGFTTLFIALAIWVSSLSTGARYGKKSRSRPISTHGSSTATMAPSDPQSNKHFLLPTTDPNPTARGLSSIPLASLPRVTRTTK